MFREPDAMSCKWPSIEELHVVVAEEAARSFSLAISPGAKRLAPGYARGPIIRLT